MKIFEKDLVTSSHYHNSPRNCFKKKRELCARFWYVCKSPCCHFLQSLFNYKSPLEVDCPNNPTAMVPKLPVRSSVLQLSFLLDVVSRPLSEPPGDWSTHNSHRSPQTPLPSMGLAALLTVSWLNFTSHSRIQALPLYHCICPVLLIQLVPELQVKQWKCLSFVQPFFFGIWLRLRWVSPLPRGVLTRTPGPTKPWSCRWWRHRAKPTKWPVTLAAQHHNMSSFRNSNVHQNLRDIELEIWCKLIKFNLERVATNYSKLFW